MKLTVRKGASFLLTLRPETATQKYVPIESITMTDSGARLVATGHELLDGWRFRVSRCKGLTRLNTIDEDHPRSADWFSAVVVDAGTIEINTSNTTGDKAYTGGGVLQYSVPMDLTGATVRAQIRASESTSSALLLDLAPYITVDAANCRIDIAVPGSATSLLVGSQAVLGVEIDDSAPVPLTITLPTIGVEFEAEVVRDE